MVRPLLLESPFEKGLSLLSRLKTFELISYIEKQMSKKPILDSQAYITLGYLTVVIIGMMFDFDYYRRFNINIFEYADVLDFLLAPVKNVQLMLFAFATFVVVWIFFLLDNWWQKKWPDAHRRFNFGMTKDFTLKYRPYMFGFTLVLYFFIASGVYGEKMYEDYQEGSEMIEVVFESDQRVIKGKLIGKNTDYIFMEAADKTIKAIPVSSDVQEIIISRP